MKIEKQDHKHYKYIAYGNVGDALNGHLKLQVTNHFCPESVMEALDKIVEDNYERGFNDALDYVRSYVMFVEEE